MRIQRFLAAAWATVHGPSDPRNLLLSLLDNGFAGLSASPGPRAVDWSAVRAAADDLPIGFAGVRAAGPLSDSSPLNGFSSEVAGELGVARRAVSAAVTMARTLGAPLVVLDLGVVSVLGDIECGDLGAPGYEWGEERAKALLARRNVGRDAAVERACRELFDLMKRYEDIDFCITQSRSVRSVVDVAALHDIYADLSNRSLGYWHDAALCARNLVATTAS